MKKGIFFITIAQIICLFLNVLNNFLLPKYLSVESYSVFKTYTLYITYAGFLHFGFNDGVYLKYGGINLEQINNDEVGNELKSFMLLEIPLTIFLVVLGLIFKSSMLIYFSFGMFGFNLISFLKYFYQAIGNFSGYSFTICIEGIAVFILNVIFIFFFLSDSPWQYIGIKIIVSFIVSLILIYFLNQKKVFISYGRARIYSIIYNIKNGFTLMLGNFSSGIFTGMDRFFVKYLLDSTCFAMYSFAVSMEAVVNTCISPITISMYNYFCKENNQSNKKIKIIKNNMTILGMLVIAIAFPAKLIINIMLPNYFNSIYLVFILFATQLPYIVVKGVYVNLYKARNQQNRYFFQMITMIIVAFVLNTILFYIFNSQYSIALATLLTSFIWLFICDFADISIRYNIKEYFAIIFVSIIYLLCGIFLNPYIGCVVYLLCMFILCMLVMKDSVLILFDYLKEGYNVLSNRFIKK